MKKYILLLPFTLLLMACPQGGNKGEPKQIITPITFPSKWRIIGFETNGNKQTVKDNSYIELNTKNTGSVYVGCNMGGFEYNLGTNNSIKIDAIMSTRMYCNDISKTESALFSSLKKIDTYQYDGETLELKGEKTIIQCKAF